MNMRGAIKILEEQTGVVIPLYLSPNTDDEQAEMSLSLLRDTVHGFAREINDPTNICLTIDGSPRAAEQGRQMVAEYGVQLVEAERNRGKLAAVRNAVAKLLEKTDLHYIISADSDCDHFANEALNFVWAAEHVASQLNTERVLVLGDRRSCHRPMGFLRGELEELADRMMMDALHYDAAITGTPMTLQFTNTLDEYPDFHSGYKLYTRQTAIDVFTTSPNMAGCGEFAYYRHNCEAVPIVEAIKSGGTLATVNRRTFDEQPVSTFAQLNRAQLTADMIIWPCKRLNVPGHFVAQWLDNHLPRLVLSTLVPSGREELVAVRDLVLDAFDQQVPPKREVVGGFVRPLFV
ncbi:MAG: hypothetical protein AAF639_23360 [Chloroflexota bacterium]